MGNHNLWIWFWWRYPRLSLRRIIMIQSIGKLKVFHDDLYLLFLDSIYKHVLLCTCNQNIDFNICLIFDKQILQCIIENYVDAGILNVRDLVHSSIFVVFKYNCFIACNFKKLKFLPIKNPGMVIRYTNNHSKTECACFFTRNTCRNTFLKILSKDNQHFFSIVTI